MQGFRFAGVLALLLCLFTLNGCHGQSGLESVPPDVVSAVPITTFPGVTGDRADFERHGVATLLAPNLVLLTEHQCWDRNDTVQPQGIAEINGHWCHYRMLRSSAQPAAEDRAIVEISPPYPNKVTSCPTNFSCGLKKGSELLLVTYNEGRLTTVLGYAVRDLTTSGPEEHTPRVLFAPYEADWVRNREGISGSPAIALVDGTPTIVGVVYASQPVLMPARCAKTNAEKGRANGVATNLVSVSR